MVNYLLRLGWSYGDEEIISRDDAVKWFDLAKVGKAPSRFDMDKLNDVNSHYLRAMSDDAIWELVHPHIEASSPQAQDRVTRLMPLLKERAKTHLDIAGSIDFLIHDDAPEINEEAAALLDETAKTRLLKFAEDLPNAPWDLEGIQTFMKGWLADNELKMKDIGLPLRAALTGTKQSPSITDVLAVLGADEVRLRIQQTCKN